MQETIFDQHGQCDASPKKFYVCTLVIWIPAKFAAILPTQPSQNTQHILETRVSTRQKNNGNSMLSYYSIKWHGEKTSANAVCHFLEEKII